jgi:tripartite-type tricarboxylate transporter receptor subunit TctC
MKYFKIIRTVLTFFLTCGALAPNAFAQAPYPNRQLQLIVPFPAGGPTDIVARLYAQQLSKLAGQPVIVENVSGAAGIIGTQNAARAEPNGYTILFSTASTGVINQVIMKNLPYNFQKDFSMIALIANAPHLLVVNANLPVKNLTELIALAKQTPGKLSFASAGAGSIVQMGGELFKYQSGIDILHVPYKGGAPATMAVLKGEVDLIVNDLSTFKAQIEDGKLRALAVAHTSRLKPLPQVPTFIELGMPDMVSSSWWGIAVPVKTSSDIQAKLRAWNDIIIANPDYVARLAEMAIEPLIMTPEQTQQFLQGELKKWQAVAARANIQLD